MLLGHSARLDLRAISCLAVALFPLLASAQMEIDEVVVTSGPAYDGGFFTDYAVDPVVLGTGIASVTLDSQNGVLDDIEMVEVTPGEFVCDQEIPSEPCENFTSLAQITALGDLSFSFVGDLGETDSVTVPLADYDPGSGQTGFPAVVFPADGQTGVSPSATIEWSAAPGWVEAIEVGLEDTATGISADEDLFLGTPPATTTWSPSGMSNGNVYDFEISFFDLFLIQVARSSSGSDGFVYTSAYESYNQTAFAVPEPGRLPALAAGATLLLGLARRRLRQAGGPSLPRA